MPLTSCNAKNKVVVSTTEWLPWLQTNWRDMQWLWEVCFGIETNCIRQPKGYSCQVHLTTTIHWNILITSVLPSPGYKFLAATLKCIVMTPHRCSECCQCTVSSAYLQPIIVTTLRLKQPNCFCSVPFSTDSSLQPWVFLIRCFTCTHCRWAGVTIMHSSIAGKYFSAKNWLDDARRIITHYVEELLWILSSLCLSCIISLQNIVVNLCGWPIKN